MVIMTIYRLRYNIAFVVTSNSTDAVVPREIWRVVSKEVSFSKQELDMKFPSSLGKKEKVRFSIKLNIFHDIKISTL